MSAIRRTQQRLRRFVFTLNNYSDVEWKDLTELLPLQTKWGIIGKECGENGTPHLQGACVIGKQMCFTNVKKMPGLSRAHIEEMRGTPAQSVVYCSKDDAEPFTWGELPEPGKRNDIAEACSAILSGSTMRDLALKHGPAVVKFSRGFTTYKSLIQAPRDVSEPPTVYWLYGSTGTGKTRSAWAFANALYPDSIWTMSDSLNWFDGYDGQAAVILDDFRSKGLKFNFFLKLLDRYPLSVPFKGGFVNWIPKLIIITSPNDICTTFSKRAEHIPEDLEQLARRITGRFCFPDDLEHFNGLLVTEDVTPTCAQPSIVLDTQLSGSESDVFSLDGELFGSDLLRRTMGDLSHSASSVSSDF